MIVYKNKDYETRSAYSNSNWLEGTELEGTVLCVVNDNNYDLCNKIQNYYPNFDVIFDEKDSTKVIDIIKTEPVITDEDISIAKNNAMQNIKNQCAEIIYSGCDADVLDRGNLHYSLTVTKQADIKELRNSIETDATKVLWHDDSRVTHEIYTAEQFINLVNIITVFIYTCKITSDWHEQSIIDIVNDGRTTNETKLERLNNYSWQNELSETYQKNIDNQLKIIFG